MATVCIRDNDIVSVEPGLEPLPRKASNLALVVVAALAPNFIHNFSYLSAKGRDLIVIVVADLNIGNSSRQLRSRA